MLRVAFALLFGLILAEAQPLPEAAAQLASRISSLLPRRATVSLDLRTLMTKPPDGWSSFRGQLQDALQKAGIQVAGTPAAAQPDWRVVVTLSESARGPLFVAEAVTGDTHQVTMLPWTPPRAEDRPRMTLVNKTLWTQPEPVLDVLLLNSGQQMLVLSTSNVTSYQMSGGKWTFASSAPLTLSRPMPRDPRGRILSAVDGFRVYVPGATCTGTTQPALQLNCAPGNETWNDVRWVTDRNVLESDKAPAARYSPTVPPASGAEGWGSDIAAMDNPCTQNAIAIADGNNSDHDQVQAFEIAGGQASAASEPLAVPGAVTALWPAETRGQVTVVVRDLQTGDYAASRLGLACAQ
ncbi:MAG TPA: hypothetical protein VMH80_09810 [Bryobacteraceae bacterium]|nr:hypothetical protein [Bryobacteraceae bacterium]